ncbi:MAG: acetyl-CoA carboxylase biotin carboxyl carrier protein subunit, partial [Solirubrobacterales bacterium]
VIGDSVRAAAPAAQGAGLRRPPKREGGGGGTATSAASEDLVSPLQGTVLKVAVEEGAQVAEGDLICVIEAMKMENEINAHREGKVSQLPISEGASIGSGDLLARIE